MLFQQKVSKIVAVDPEKRGKPTKLPDGMLPGI
jgi:hypothetical protein